MAKLIVRLHGQEIAQLNLESGHEYVAGRAPDAQIRLDNQRGISRHHLKFYEADGQWICEALSKFVLMHQGDKSSEILELNEACVFMLPPYEFQFEPTASPVAEAPIESQQVQAAAPSEAEAASSVPEHTVARANNEATVAGVSHLVPYVRVSYPNTADDEVLKLEGHLWVAGRDHDCEIPIDSPHVSRKHFELARTAEGFFLTDLGSSNGTKVNGTKLAPHEPTKIESGDEIVVMNVHMSFEIRDTHFANRVDNLPVPVFNPMFSNLPTEWTAPEGADERTQYLPSRQEESAPSLREWKKLRPRHLKQVNWKKNKARVAIVLMLPVILFLMLTPDKPKTPADGGANHSPSFEKLTQESKAVVKDSFNLARNLYVQGKYTLCLTELAKVHERIPQYENSKELQSFCEQGLELVRRQEDIDRKDREKAMIEQQISGYVEACKTKLTESSTVDETRQCLAEAIVLSPEHPLVMEMIHSAQMHEEERKFLSEQRKVEDSKAARGEAHYQRAYHLYKTGKLSASITELERYVKTPYPRSANTKEKARRQIASIKKELTGKVNNWIEQCKAVGSKNRYREAYKICDKAVQEDSDNADAKDYRDKMLLDLRRDMKAIYEDSVLEESLGNVDSAKEKWKKIVDEDLPFDDYAKKAKSKLQKYGVGL